MILLWWIFVLRFLFMRWYTKSFIIYFYFLINTFLVNWCFLQTKAAFTKWCSGITTKVYPDLLFWTYSTSCPDCPSRQWKYPERFVLSLLHILLFKRPLLYFIPSPEWRWKLCPSTLNNTWVHFNGGECFYASGRWLVTLDCDFTKNNAHMAFDTGNYVQYI